jgi:hypothetical protein
VANVLHVSNVTWKNGDFLVHYAVCVDSYYCWLQLFNAITGLHLPIATL